MRAEYRNVAILTFAAAVVWILFQAGEVLVPFVLAGIFAFALNPIVSLISKHVRLPRSISILLVYLILISLIIGLLALVLSRLIFEFRQITVTNSLEVSTRQFIDSLPQWEIAGQSIGLQGFANQTLASLTALTSNLEVRAVAIFSGALREGVYLLVFLVSGFYLLKDGKKIKSAIESVIPESNHDDFVILWSKLQVIMGNYLRGQLLLMLIIGTLSYILFESLGIKYAAILAVIAGLLEVVPIIGPILTAAVATSLSFLTGDNRFGLEPTTLALAVVAGCFVIQQLENYVVVPNLYARLTELHPALVLFVVIVGGAVFGLIGFILAVPVTASAKVVIQYLASKT